MAVISNLQADVHYHQVLSMALEDRSRTYEDLVSNNNAMLAVLRRKGLWRTYSGPRIRQTLQINKQDAQWYSGYDQLLNPAIDLFNDVYYVPKMVVVPVILSYQEILNNEGDAQILDTLENYMDAAERSLEDTMDAAIYSDGTLFGGKQLTGLQTALPRLPATGTYAGVDRTQPNNLIWVPTSWDASAEAGSVPVGRTGLPAALGTQIDAAHIRPMLNYIMTKQSRGRDYADLLIMSPEHYAAYDAATVAIQRINNTSGLGQLGFSTLEYIGGGKRAEIVLDGGIGSNMPANTTFGIDTSSFRIRYNANRNFDKLFKGDGQMPIDKDAIAQFIGWMGELTVVNPMFNWRFYDSNAAT